MVPAPAAMLLRSWLFCPGSTPGRFEKASACGTDAVIVDLEDAVAPDDKAAARAAALAWLGGTDRAGVARCLRSNALRTAAGLRDILALVDGGVTPDFLVIPKTETADEMALLDTLLIGSCSRTQFLPLVETARGVVHAEEIAAHPRVAGLVLGGADLAADLGAAMDWEPLLYARSRLVHAAATAGIAVIDVPRLDLGDEAGLREETQRVRRLGFTGKLAIHPGQVATINDAYTPDDADVARARRIVAAVEAARGGVAVVDGRMVDAPVVRAAERVLARAERVRS